MAYQFQVDARILGTDAVLPNPGVFVDGPQTVAMTPPFGNCKVKVSGLALVLSSDDATEFAVQIIRNPDAEAVIVTMTFVTFAGIVANTYFAIPIAGVDQVPDGRDVSYLMQVRMFSVAHTGQLSKRSYIEAALLSG